MKRFSNKKSKKKLRKKSRRKSRRSFGRINKWLIGLGALSILGVLYNLKTPRVVSVPIVPVVPVVPVVPIVSNYKTHLDQFLKEYKLRLQPIAGDGNCLFHSLTYYLNNIAKINITQQQLRKQITDYMDTNWRTYIPNWGPIINHPTHGEISIPDFINFMRKDGEYGDEHIITVFHDIYYQFPIVIYDIQSTNHLNIQHNYDQNYNYGSLITLNAIILVFDGGQIGGHYEIAVPK